METEPPTTRAQPPFTAGGATLRRTAASSGVSTVPAGLAPDLVRAIRKAAGFSQARLATELGVSITTVGTWERGERAPQRRNLHQLELLYRSLTQAERHSA